MYAIIETGGKQYRVTPGDVVALERLQGEIGQTVTFDKVLLIGGKADNQILVGAPYVTQASLQAEIVEQTRGEKILTIKYKRRKGYRRTIGHRQELTRILVTKIDDGRGHALQFESTKRADTLRTASVAFSERQKKHEQAHQASAAGSSKKSAPRAQAEPASKKAAAKAADAPTRKRAPAGDKPAKKTTSKKKA